MSLNVLFAARPERWVTYEAPLRQALDAAGITAHLSTDITPQDVDYIVYAPNSTLQDFDSLHAGQGGAKPLGGGRKYHQQ